MPNNDLMYLTIKLSITKEQIANLELEKKLLEDVLMEKMEEKTVEFCGIRATKVETNKITYNIDAMKDILNKSKLAALCDKEILVDKAELRELFRDMPELKATLSKALKVEYIPNADKVKRAIDNQIISNKELKKIASIKTSEYIKVTKQENEENV